MPSRLLLFALCAAAATASAQGAPADFDELPEPAQQRFCGLLLDTLLDRTVAELQADEAGGGSGALRKRAFVLAELRLANESLLYGSGSERDLRLSQSLMERVSALPPADSRPYVARRAGPVALPPAASTGGQDAWFPTEPARQGASSPVAER